MFHVLTPEEIEQGQKELGELYASTNIEDNVCAILRDMSIGNHGMIADKAKIKAAAILEFLRRGNLLRLIEGKNVDLQDIAYP